MRDLCVAERPSCDTVGLAKVGHEEHCPLKLVVKQWGHFKNVMMLIS